MYGYVMYGGGIVPVGFLPPSSPVPATQTTTATVMVGNTTTTVNACPPTNWLTDAQPSTAWQWDGCVGILNTTVAQVAPEAFMDDSVFAMDDGVAFIDS